MRALVMAVPAVVGLLAWVMATAPVAAGETLPDTAALQPGAADRFVVGMFVYMADAARLTECRTGRSYPVAMEEDYLRAEQAYLQAREEPGQPLMVTFDGTIEDRPRMEGGGSEPAAVIHRFINVWPGETCERNLADAPLTNTYWRIVRLGDQAVQVAGEGREPHLLLLADQPRFRATAGCNQINGGYHFAGPALQFDPPASTMMACPPPVDLLEGRLIDMLRSTASWRVNAQFLEFGDAAGTPIALFQAVYLR